MAGFRIFILLLLFMGYTAKDAEAAQRRPASEQTSAADDSASRMLAFRHPFVDSMRADSLQKILHGRFSINIPKQVVPRVIDPFDPFNHQAFYRRGQGRFWFFLVTLIILGLFIYYRSAFPKQFMQRIRGLWNRHYFEELIADYSLSFTGGSIVCLAFSTLVMTQLGVLLVVYGKYVQLNSLIFYLVLLIGVLAWRGLIYLVQRLQAYVLNTGDALRVIMQRQISVDMWVSLLVFPIVNLVYFNSSRLAGFPVQSALSAVLVGWLSVRIISEFTAMVGEGRVSFTRMLYFCALEILPHAILATALLRIPASK